MSKNMSYREKTRNAPDRKHFPGKGPVSRILGWIISNSDEKNQKVNMSQHIQACE